MSGITSDIQLYNKAKGLNVKINKIDYKDKLGSPRKGNYIVNLASSTSFGTHWVACIIDDKVAYYFDSFGFPPPLEIRKFIKKRDIKKIKKIIYSNKQIQKLNSNFCGDYCILFLFRMKESNNNFNKFVSNFETQ